MEFKYIVYITINQCNGKFYIGVHKTNPEVFDGYIGNGIFRQNQANKEFTFHKAVRKYGYENFKRTTIQVFPGNEEGKQQALQLEALLVNNTLLRSKECYNESLGGTGNLEEVKKTVYMFDLNGEYLRSFSCIRDAATYINNKDIESTLKAIRNNCLGNSNSSFGYYWSYKKEFGYNNRKQTPIAQYTISGKFLRTFKSITEAESLLELNSIQQAIIKKYSCGGFQWRYFNGDTQDIPKLLNIKSKNKLLPIIMINKNTLEQQEFDCVQDCISKNPDLKASQINRVLAGVIKSHKGYIFKYKDEDIV